MVGFLASMRVFPHLLDDDGLRIRSGTTTDIRIPWEAIASVTTRRGSGPTAQVERSDDGVIVNIAVLKQTKVAVVLHRPTTLEPPDDTEQVTELRFYADEPRALVAAARERLTDRSAGERPLRPARSRRVPGSRPRSGRRSPG